MGPIRVACTRHPLVPPDVPVGPILVSGWTGRVDGSTLHPKITALKACNISGRGVVCQPPPIPPNRVQDQQRGLEMATNVFLSSILGIQVCIGASLDGRTTREWAVSNPQHVMGLRV